MALPIKPLRALFFIAALICSIIVLGVNAYLTDKYLLRKRNYENYCRYYPEYCGDISFPPLPTDAILAFVVSVLTIVTLPILLILSFVKKGAGRPLLFVEAGWVFVLWVLWLAFDGYIQNELGRYSTTPCDGELGCQLTRVTQAFGWIAWIVLFFCFILLVIHAITWKPEPVNASATTTAAAGSAAAAGAYKQEEANGATQYTQQQQAAYPTQAYSTVPQQAGQQPAYYVAYYPQAQQPAGQPQQQYYAQQPQQAYSPYPQQQQEQFQTPQTQQTQLSPTPASMQVATPTGQSTGSAPGAMPQPAPAQPQHNVAP